MKRNAPWSVVSRRFAAFIVSAFQLRALLLLLVAIALTSSWMFISRHARAQSLAKPETTVGNAPPHAIDYGNLPLSFEDGASGESGRFIARGKGYALALTQSGAAISLHQKSDSSASGAAVPNNQILGMNLKGASSGVVPKGLDELPGKVNYLIGNDQRKWRTNLRTFARVSYQQIYPGIDLVYYGNQQELEYDFWIAPGADAKQIRLQFRGAQRLSLTHEGDLLIATTAGELRLVKPRSYQEVGSVRHDIETSYVLKGNQEVLFSLGSYDRTLPLTIDPVLIYSTFLGGTVGDVGNGIAVDSSGNAYITGETSSTDFPVNSFQSTKGGSADVFVTKLNPAARA